VSGLGGSGFGEEQKVIVLVGLGEVVLLDEVEAGALDFGDDDVRVDAVVVAAAGVVDDGEAGAGLHGSEKRCEQQRRMSDLVVDAQHERGVE